MEQEKKIIINNFFVSGGQANIVNDNGVINSTQNIIEEKNQSLQKLKQNKIMYYFSKKVLEQLLGIDTENKSQFTLVTYFIEHKKELNIYDDIFKVKDKIGKNFKFKSRCKIDENFMGGAKTQIIVETELNNCIIKGACSVKNWISESYLNNLLFAKSAKLECVGKVIEIKELNDKVYIDVQFLLIGEEGIFND